MYRVTTAIAFLAVSLLVACQPEQVRTDEVNCNRLFRGMPQREVESIMGSGGSTRTLEAELFADRVPRLELTYSQPILASGPITVWLKDGGAGYQVEELWCHGQH